MKEKFKEIYQKATKNDWSGEQLEEALKEAGITAEDIPDMQELDLEEMASVAGGEGADPATCKHELVSRCPKYDTFPSEDGFGYRFKRSAWVFKCMECGQKWSGPSDRFNYIPGWKGQVIKD